LAYSLRYAQFWRDISTKSERFRPVDGKLGILSEEHFKTAPYIVVEDFYKKIDVMLMAYIYIFPFVNLLV
jgi:hypothetical protein